ncbi:MAG TPA: formyltransferase family protein [Kofleriaceae bacterium]|nr:formyltransferase family protein [Kofleriaceae bacterium]
MVVFVDPNMANSMELLAGHLQGAAERDDVEVVAIVDTAPEPPPRLELARSLAVRAVHFTCNPIDGAGKTLRPLFSTCAALARRWRVPLLAPRERGINDPEFVETVRRLRPDVGISLMVAQIFRAPLLDACAVPLNYHPGLLPHYRGIAATGWSIYKSERESGFTFHRMVEQVDRGPILLQGTVPLGPRSIAAQTERAKTKAARARLAEWFDILAAREFAGVEQTDGSTFTRVDERAIRTVEHPEQLSLDELDLRLRAFEYIYLTLAGQDWAATALRRLGRSRRDRRLAFTTADGVAVRVSRLRHVPPMMYRALKPLYGSPHSPPRR